MNRGSRLERRYVVVRALRFNEAPIHESGKFTGTLRTTAVGEGFNEAPIHESGKYALVTDEPPEGTPASMRPRFMNRGSSWRGKRSPHGRPGFNEAPIHESGK